MLINSYGVFYPYKDHATYALAERSLAYRDLLTLQLEDVSLLAELARSMPVYYDYFGYYRFEYPELGYSDGPVESGRLGVSQSRVGAGVAGGLSNNLRLPL